MTLNKWGSIPLIFFSLWWLPQCVVGVPLCQKDDDCGPRFVCLRGKCTFSISPHTDSDVGDDASSDVGPELTSPPDSRDRLDSEERIKGGEGACPPGLTPCERGQCSDLSRDHHHCGKCGNRCPPGTSCIRGKCEIVCPNSQTLCNKKCVDLLSDIFNCGRCGNRCPVGAQCVNGSCSCPTVDYAVCLSGNRRICVDVRSSHEHCGRCGNRCLSGRVCSDGKCRIVCREGLTVCGGGCVDTRTDRNNCGKCGNRCSADQRCEAGVCKCPAGMRWCKPLGRCLNQSLCCSDADCAKGETCYLPSGRCVSCKAGEKWCEAQNRCVNLSLCCDDKDCSGGMVCDVGIGRCACRSGEKWCAAQKKCISASNCCDDKECSGGMVCDVKSGSCACRSGEKWCAAKNRCISVKSCCRDLDCSGIGGAGKCLNDGRCYCTKGALCSDTNECVGSCYQDCRSGQYMCTKDSRRGPVCVGGCDSCAEAPILCAVDKKCLAGGCSGCSDGILCTDSNGKQSCVNTCDSTACPNQPIACFSDKKCVSNDCSSCSAKTLCTDATGSKYCSAASTCP